MSIAGEVVLTELRVSISSPLKMSLRTFEAGIKVFSFKRSDMRIGMMVVCCLFMMKSDVSMESGDDAETDEG